VWRADVLAHTRPHCVTVECLGRHWELAPSAAHEWIGAIGFDPDTLAGVFPGAVADEDLDDMWGRIRADPQRQRPSGDSSLGDELRDCARTSVGLASGRDWWWSVNLTRKALSMWPYINGLLLLQGIDAEKMRFAQWLDACFMLLWKDADEGARRALDLELNLPPAGVHAPKASKKMLAAFASD
jgi:hypothetical protein